MVGNGAWVSNRVSGIALSAIKEMAMRSARVEGAASLTWGVPSFQTPDHIRAAVARQLEADPEIGKYSLPDGLAELRQAVAAHHLAATGVAADAERNVMVTAGNIQGLNALFHAIIDAGDEIILTDPGFVSHIQQIELCGGVPVYWAMDEERGWSLDVEALAGLITERTKAIVLVTPSNPTGKIFREDELRRIGALAEAHDLLIMIDDPYSPFVYDHGDLFFNLASVSELAGRIAYLFTFSKAYAMSGWRAGYMVVPEHIKRQVLKVQDLTIICPPRISQVAALAALCEEPVHLPAFRDALARRRRLICARLDRLPHAFSYVVPEGAYYVIPKILAEHEDSLEFSLRLLEKAKVTVTPGRAFGPAGEHHVRMGFCMDDDIIETAFDRMEAYFGG